TTANIVMSNLLTVADPPQAALGVLSFFATGGLIALAGMFYLAAFGQRSLPRREARFEQEFARRAGTELEDLYAVGEHLWEARVQESSDFLGLTLKDSGIGQKFGVVVAAMRRGRHAFFVPLMSEMLQQDDILLIVGQEDRVSILAKLGLQVRPETHTLTDFGLSLLEIILMPHSAYVGKTLKEINFRNRYGFVAIALLHEQHSHRTDIAKMPLELGDSLLMLGSQKHLRDLRANPNIIIFEPDPSMRPVPRRRAVISIMLFLTAIVLSIAGVPVYLSVLTAALLAILFGFLSIQDAYRSLEWQVIFFVAGMYVASLSMIHTGLAALIGRAAIDLIGNAGPLGLAASAFWLSALLTQFMGSQATAFVVGPIAISAAIHLNANPQAIAVATAIGCSASFLTPFSHPVNLIMVGPGNYRFGDFFRVGAGLMVVVFITLLIGMTLFWRL
ncbi:MAG TPA: SLC13 family permease, partial [Anaerolineales bacterium]|nr:SLC13 family permease [Anaerolineales bacterium]